MPLFVAKRLYERLLPLSLQPLLTELDNFDQLSTALRREKRDQDDPRVHALREMHADLQSMARAHLRPSPDVLDLTVAIEAFCLGAMLLAHYETTVHGQLPLVDTCGSKTLPIFRTDFAHSPANVRKMRAALTRAFDPCWETIDAAIAPDLERLRIRHDLMEALEDLQPLRDDRDAFALFCRLFPGHPLREGDLHVVRTGTSLFFPISHRQALPDWERRPEDEKRSITAFLRNARGFHQTYLHNFPVFGTFRSDDAEPSLLDALVSKTGLPEEIVRDKLSSMVSILPAADLDKYLVHDAWGHQWQRHLLPFEVQFRQLATYGSLPNIRRRYALNEVHAASLLDLIDRELDPEDEHWAAWMRAVFEERLYAATGASVAEALADLAEYKLVRLLPEGTSLPSSSYFSDLPGKLDLMLDDLRSFLTIAFTGLGTLEGEDGAEALSQMISAQRPALPDEALASLVSMLQGHAQRLLSTRFSPTFIFGEEQDSVSVNLHARMALNTLGYQTVQQDVLQRLDGRDPAPLLGFTDLLMLAVGAFYQHDPATNIWHLDEFVGLAFLPLVERLLAALEAPQTPDAT